MHTAQPFRPFRIHMAGGRSLEGHHPWFPAQSPGGRSIVVAKADEAFEILDLLLVTSLEPINRQTRGSGGKKEKSF
jgi:hypothetical protein